MSFSNYAQLEESFAKQVWRILKEASKWSFFFKDVHPGDLKNCAAEYLNRLLEPIRKEFESEDMQKLILNAYPPPVPVQQKKSI
jgi:hypothetical protein